VQDDKLLLHSYYPIEWNSIARNVSLETSKHIGKIIFVNHFLLKYFLFNLRAFASNEIAIALRYDEYRNGYTSYIVSSHEVYIGRVESWQSV